MNKYGNKKVVYLGEVFDSKREMYRYMDLCFLVRAGAISGLRRQVVYELIPVQREKSTRVYKKGRKKGQPIEGKIIEKAVTYVADFVYIDNATGKEVVEDAKGIRTRDYIIKRKLMLYIHGIKIREW
jgi:hypothetical protein